MIDKKLEETIREVEEEAHQKEFIENINKKLDRLVNSQEEANFNEKVKEFKKMNYSERVDLFNSDPELYNKLRDKVRHGL
ncbi:MULTISPECIES: hypothetical protein [Streptococcus]|jgi:hypothetical protein|uniref:hypothetical protein n=1 Tax=Streptococcus TaxID=1301 RepID=UPI000779C749|nr:MULTISPECIES: hypothetical protein [Streptococcus]QBX11188.1 hypothetical protein JavanS545_0017 [Streptococcus satellite phage Javan545]WNU95015.1 hypothetical protein RSK81_01075 [Streptococcus sp. DTU_2020_1000888_1_SI_GRL_NUU_041A]DAJ48448.1 MAG TPA: hypothetical protein [Caudoviricetes sp.]